MNATSKIFWWILVASRQVNHLKESDLPGWMQFSSFATHCKRSNACVWFRACVLTRWCNWAQEMYDEFRCWTTLAYFGATLLFALMTLKSPYLSKNKCINSWLFWVANHISATRAIILKQGSTCSGTCPEATVIVFGTDNKLIRVFFPFLFTNSTGGNRCY